MMQEIWKDIPGYNGRYQASSFGRIRRALDNRIVPGNLGVHGYMISGLMKGDKYVPTRTHILVARTFIPNPDNLPCINHKDENKTNNRVDNLEWCTQAYNINYGSTRERMSKNNPRKRAVEILNKAGEKIAELPCVNDAADYLDVSRVALTKALSGKTKYCKGVSVRYKDAGDKTSERADRLALELYPANVDGFVERGRKKQRKAYALDYDAAVRDLCGLLTGVALPEEVKEKINADFEINI